MDYWIDGMLEKSEHIYQLTILKIMLFFPLLGIFLPYIIFFLIILLLEIDLTNDIKSPICNISRMMFKHFPGFIILLFYYNYHFTWAEYYAGHYPVASGKEFKLFSSLDRGSNFIATIGIFYIFYAGIFLYLNKYWFNQEWLDKSS